VQAAPLILSVRLEHRKKIGEPKEQIFFILKSTPEAVRSHAKKQRLRLSTLMWFENFIAQDIVWRKFSRGICKSGSVQAKRAMTDFVAAMKKTQPRLGYQNLIDPF